MLAPSREVGLAGAGAISPSQSEVGQDIEQFVENIATDLSDGLKVALGFECPLFVPVTDDPKSLSRACQGEKNRPWSAGAGSSSLATGLTICAWVFDRLPKLTQTPIRPTFDWASLTSTEANLFVWEAFVSGKAKASSRDHREDARIAAEAFWARYPHMAEATEVRAENLYSLVGAALLRAGLAQDLSILSEPCIVIKA